MKGTKEDVKRQKHSQTSDEGCVPSSQEAHPSSSPSCAVCGSEERLGRWRGLNGLGDWWCRDCLMESSI